MGWMKFAVIIGDAGMVEVRELNERLFAFNHACLATDMNRAGEFSTTNAERALQFARQIAQTGGLG